MILATYWSSRPVGSISITYDGRDSLLDRLLLACKSACSNFFVISALANHSRAMTNSNASLSCGAARPMSLLALSYTGFFEFIGFEDEGAWTFRVF